MSEGSDPETARVAERYARRDVGDRYHTLNPDVWQAAQERQRALLRLLARLGWRDLAARRIVEVGCGSGANLLELLRIGFAPQHLQGVELLADRYAAARLVLPEALRLHHADAAAIDLGPAAFDAVLVSTVFSSLLDPAFRQRLAGVMWRWVKPGGGVLWYDFTIDNPNNPDVRGVSLAALRALFPEASMQHRRLTLAPPLARAVCRVHPALYTVFNALPPLRTHVLCWLGKPA